MRRVKEFFWSILNQLPLKKKIIYLFMPIVIIPMALIVTFSSSIAANATIHKAVENSQDKLGLISKQIDMLISNIEYNVRAFSTSQILQEAMNLQYEEGDYGELKFSSKVQAAISSVTSIGNFIENSMVITAYGRIFNTLDRKVTLDPKIISSDFYRLSASRNGRIILTDLHDNEKEKNVRSLTALNISKSVIDINRGECIGVISLDIKESSVSRVYSNIKNGKTGEYFIINNKGIIVSSEDKGNLFTSIKNEDYFKWVVTNKGQGRIFRVDGIKMLVTSAPLDRLNWYVVSTVPIHELTEENFKLTVLIIILGFVFVLITIMASVVLAKNITNPVSRLVSYTKEISAGNLDIGMKVSSRDEIGELAEHFKVMVDNIKDLLLKNYQEQKKKREYELSLLQSQVNPHFLYNSIENISSLILRGDAQGANEVVCNLGSYYKGVLSKGRNVITIEEDIELTENYMKIQQIRHEELFKYQIEIEQEILNSRILKLTLQPIVENCINHGFKGYKLNGTIKIKGWLEKDMIFLEILDDGKGIEEESIKKIFCDNDMNAVRKSFGLKNIDERIKLQFGEGYGIKVDSVCTIGTRVTVKLPLSYSKG